MTEHVFQISAPKTVGFVSRDSQPLEPLISHVFKPKDVVEAYKILDETPAEAVQVVLDFRDGV